MCVLFSSCIRNRWENEIFLKEAEEWKAWRLISTWSESSSEAICLLAQCYAVILRAKGNEEREVVSRKKRRDESWHPRFRENFILDEFLLCGIERRLAGSKRGNEKREARFTGSPWFAVFLIRAKDRHSSFSSSSSSSSFQHGRLKVASFAASIVFVFLSSPGDDSWETAGKCLSPNKESISTVSLSLSSVPPVPPFEITICLKRFLSEQKNDPLPFSSPRSPPPSRFRVRVFVTVCLRGFFFFNQQFLFDDNFRILSEIIHTLIIYSCTKMFNEWERNSTGFLSFRFTISKC